MSTSFKDLGVPADLVAALLAASPLTDLLTAARLVPPFAWSAALVALLRDVEIARSVAYLWLAGAPGDAVPALARHPAAAAAAYSQLLDRPGALPPAAVRAVTAFLVHLSVLLAVAEERSPSPQAPSAVVAAALEACRPDAVHDGLTVLLALPAAAAAVDPALGAPAGLAEEAALAQRWAIHRAQVAAALADRAAALAGRLRPCLGLGAPPAAA